MGSLLAWARGHITPDNIKNRLDFTKITETLVALSKMVDSPEKVRTGGVFAFAYLPKDAPEQSMLWSVSFGSPGANIIGNGYHAVEKINRTRNRRTEGHNDSTSTQSADETNPDKSLRTYGGCVVFRGDHDGDEIYISISGGPPRVDEAMSYATGLACGFNPLTSMETPLVEEAMEMLKGVFTD
ncbi:MAG: hypothetical protein JWP09_127 [Candidatus Taylorbacteria bacterium]|nr:hypothetical protein [Candidatus Taylorbacteria bacterium]